MICKEWDCGKSTEDSFLKRLVEYMNERYERVMRAPRMMSFSLYAPTSPHRIRAVDGRVGSLRWRIFTNRMLPSLEGYSDGRIFAISGSVLDDIFLDYCYSTSPMSLEEGRKVLKAIINRRGLEKLELEYLGVAGELDYEDRVAREISEKTGIKVKHAVHDYFDTCFYSSFNARKMNYTDKMKVIIRMFNAVDMAFQEAWNFNRLWSFLLDHGYLEEKEDFFKSMKDSASTYWENVRYRIPRYGAIRILKMDEDRTYIGLRDGRLIVSNQSGILWIFLSRGTIYYATPLVTSEDGTIFFSSEGKSFNSRYLYALNSDGTLKWEFKFENVLSIETLVLTDKMVYIVSHFIEGHEPVSTLYAISLNGSLKWKFNVNALAGSPAIGLDETVYLLCSNSYVYALNPDGNVKWELKVDGGILYTFPVLVGPDGAVTFKTLVESKILNFDKESRRVEQLFKYCFCTVNPDGSVRWKRYSEEKHYEPIFLLK